ncbi:MAG: ribulose-phosphate 3-epimerase [Candidatus Wolfebacteria bacterium]|nr:ribulose-phosphate 3-epimerase [Candidatus Wolfebacteria bacterium]
MQVIPTINCLRFACITEKIKKAAEFLPLSGWVQIDIADGKFTEYKTWDNPSELLNLTSYFSGLSLEVHLMVEKPEQVINAWIKAGAKRILIHAEAIKNEGFKIEDLRSKIRDVEIGLVINPETPAEALTPYLELKTSNYQPKTKFVQILAVPPGKSGQKFDERVLGKIKFLRQNYSNVIIEVDGGINLETAKLCKDAGADILAVGSYIWGDDNPKEVFERLVLV